MDTPWEIQWSFTGKPDMFQVFVQPKEMSSDLPGMPGIAANQMDNMPGSSYQPKAGTFYLTINSISFKAGGSWVVCVVAVPD